MCTIGNLIHAIHQRESNSKMKIPFHFILFFIFFLDFLFHSRTQTPNREKEKMNLSVKGNWNFIFQNSKYKLFVTVISCQSK